jgi:hypothetical protein
MCRCNISLRKKTITKIPKNSNQGKTDDQTETQTKTPKETPRTPQNLLQGKNHQGTPENPGEPPPLKNYPKENKSKKLLIWRVCFGASGLCGDSCALWRSRVESEREATWRRRCPYGGDRVLASLALRPQERFPGIPVDGPQPSSWPCGAGRDLAFWALLRDDRDIALLAP